MREQGAHSSSRILAGIVTIFVLLIGGTAIVVAQRMPRPLDVSFIRPGANVTPTPISYEGENGKNALALLKSHVHVTTRQASYGEYVDVVDGVPSGKDGRYWALYVNGKQPPVAAGSLITHDGDRLEWRYE